MIPRTVPPPTGKAPTENGHVPRSSTPSERVLLNNHPHGVRRTPHPNETVEAYTARMTVDENARKREAFAKFTASRGNVRTGDDGS